MDQDIIKDIANKWKPSGLLKGLSPYCEMHTALALEMQLRLNETLGLHSHHMFRRISIPVVARLMKETHGLCSGIYRNAQVEETRLSLEPTLTERFYDVMNYTMGLDRDADKAMILTSGLKDAIKSLMHRYRSKKMYFLGLTVAKNDNIAFYYNI